MGEIPDNLVLESVEALESFIQVNRSKGSGARSGKLTSGRGLLHSETSQCWFRTLVQMGGGTSIA